MSGMSDHPSASDEETRRPPAKLHDRTKIDGEPWETLKKEAMKEKYKMTVEYQKLLPFDKETVGRLIAAQRAQGDMRELIVITPDPEERVKTPELGN